MAGHFCRTLWHHNVQEGGNCKHNHLASTVAQVTAGMELRAQDQVLEKLDTFNYLVRMLYFDNIIFPMVAWNLQRERRKWGRLSYLLYLKGGLNKNLWEFYMVVVQFVLILGSELWVVTPNIMRLLGIIHNQVS